MPLFSQPTKASPAGCVVGLFGVIFLACSAMFIWGSYKVLTHDISDVLLRWKYPLLTISCLVVGIFIIRVGCKMALRADMSDSYSRSKPKMRF